MRSYFCANPKTAKRNGQVTQGELAIEVLKRAYPNHGYGVNLTPEQAITALAGDGIAPTGGWGKPGDKVTRKEVAVVVLKALLKAGVIKKDSVEKAEASKDDPKMALKFLKDQNVDIAIYTDPLKKPTGQETFDDERKFGVDIRQPGRPLSLLGEVEETVAQVPDDDDDDDDDDPGHP